jgi:hypothetical protein
MMFKKARHPAYTDDDPRIVLVLRWATEPQPGPWIPFLIGCGAFGIAMAILTVGALDLSTEEERVPPRQVTRLFIPAPRKGEQARQHPAKTQPTASKALQPELDPVKLPPMKGRVDMNSIEISVLDDSSDELPEVVRQQGGVLALVEPGDQSMARYTFKPPDWRMSDRFEDVSGRIRFSMTPASRWALLRSLADSHSIAIEKYHVDALFDSGYARCLEQEIRKRADLSPNPGRVRAALLMFTSSRSCGIDVINLEFSSR